MADDSRFESKKITPRAENYSEWYLDVIDAAQLAEHGSVKGSMIIKPTGYALWEKTQKVLDEKFKESGVENLYFPLLIPERLLHKEAQHVEGFAPEVAVVTHAGGKKLDEPLVIRPTSETIMYETFSKWIQSWRDLPLLVNQWANVLRWELRPRLFLRTTEFLWQEGHTVHATEEEADDRARMMLDVYRSFAEDYMAIPVVPGVKSDAEKFAGALRTYSIEAMMQDGKALQFATSHNLGQNFAKAFEINFMNDKNERATAWQTSWGLATRVIGGLIMVHSDDNGLVLPPRIAPVQAVIVPIWKDEASKEGVLASARELVDELRSSTASVKLDERDMRPGEKYYHWERRGIPVRIELGPKDIEKGSVVLVRRDTGEKLVIERGVLPVELPNVLHAIQQNLYDKALKLRIERTKTVDTWEEFLKEIEAGNFVMAHWDGTKETEAKIKAETAATIRCIPFDSKFEKGECVLTGKASEQRVLFARAY
jgi:prolyl-tRNA synthetase